LSLELHYFSFIVMCSARLWLDFTAHKQSDYIVVYSKTHLSTDKMLSVN